MGYFMGALGRSNVMCLLQEKVEKPGDIDGVVYTPIDKGGIWKYSLVKELKTCGYDVDANKVL
jgi:predicted nucleotide-binding protein